MVFYRWIFITTSFKQKYIQWLCNFQIHLRFDCKEMSFLPSNSTTSRSLKIDVDEVMQNPTFLWSRLCHRFISINPLDKILAINLSRKGQVKAQEAQGVRFGSPPTPLWYRTMRLLELFVWSLRAIFVCYCPIGLTIES